MPNKECLRSKRGILRQKKWSTTRRISRQALLLLLFLLFFLSLSFPPLSLKLLRKSKRSTQKLSFCKLLLSFFLFFFLSLSLSLSFSLLPLKFFVPSGENESEVRSRSYGVTQKSKTNGESAEK